MKKKMINNVHIEGYVYDHKLAVKQVKNETSANYGKDFIGGVLSVAVDEDGLNVVDVHFTYVTPTTAKGQPNRTYNALQRIIEAEEGTWLASGKDNALLVKIDTAVGVNDFISRDNQLISAKRLEGGFIDIVDNITEDLDARHWFKLDMYMNNMSHIEADPDRHIDKAYAKIKGAVFNFRNELLPVELTARSDASINYFSDLDISPANPCFIQVMGKVNNQTVKIEKTVETAFGDPYVEYQDRKNNEWEICKAIPPYEYGMDETLTDEDMKTAVAARNVHLAEVKQRDDEYKASKQTSSTTAASPMGLFNF